MRKIFLLATDGHPIAEPTIAADLPLPVVVRWRGRFFLHGSLANPARDGAHSVNFYETVGYTVEGG